MKQQVISIDIGSTYTKGALFELGTANPEFNLQQQAIQPTTVANPIDAVNRILATFNCSKNTPIYCSSSAKGGLSIVAIGIVPELTLQMAKLTAYSAGGKIIKVFAYKLTLDDIRAIDALQPDIILFAGGTDGGNEQYNLHNAKMLQALTINTSILYAGNKVIAADVTALLCNHQIDLAPNILPQIDNPTPEAAREKIREIFLKRIIECKGLTAIRQLTGSDPYPTPYSVFELVKQIPRYQPTWDSFCMLDMGGATTDFYSQHKEELEAGVVYKGLKEPDAKRTVEGDLGMRVSAEATFAAGKEYLQKILTAEELQQLHTYVHKISLSTDYLPTNQQEIYFDQLLSQVCIALAAKRHAGTRRRIFTAQGESFLQQGKNLTTVQKIIGTGGYLANMTRPQLQHNLFAIFNPDSAEEIALLPKHVEYYVDTKYLIPLLANLVHQYPEASVHSAIAVLETVNC